MDTVKMMCITGPPQSGKSHAVNYLLAAHGVSSNEVYHVGPDGWEDLFEGYRGEPTIVLNHIDFVRTLLWIYFKTLASGRPVVVLTAGGVRSLELRNIILEMNEIPVHISCQLHWIGTPNIHAEPVVIWNKGQRTCELEASGVMCSDEPVL